MNANNGVWAGRGRRLHLQEVGTRDGLQAEAAFVPTEDKVALVNMLSDAGLVNQSPKETSQKRQRRIS